MASISNSNISLPSIRTLFPPSTFSSPSSSPSSDEEKPYMPLKQKKPLSQRHLYAVPRLPLPLSAPEHARHARRISTTSSVPALTHSPSPSPSPPPSSERIRLVPCPLRVADVVVVASAHPNPSSSGKGATLLVGPAIAHAAKDDRKMHPYRISRS